MLIKNVQKKFFERNHKNAFAIKNLTNPNISIFKYFFLKL